MSKLTWRTVSIGVLLGMSAQCFAGSNLGSHSSASASDAELVSIIQRAITADYRRESLLNNVYAIQEQGYVSATEMDPKIKFGVANAPVDSFALDQDAMTSLTVGIGQQFARGDTLELNLKKAMQLSDSTREAVKLRSLTVQKSVSSLWLEIGYTNKIDQLLNQKIKLQEQLTAFQKSQYSLGKTTTEQVLKAELDLSKIHEKSRLNQQVREQLIGQLTQWVYESRYANSNFSEPTALNVIEWGEFDNELANLKAGNNFTSFKEHPLIVIAEKQIQIGETELEIRHEQFKPQFGIELAYGNRQAIGMNGKPASDVVSAFVTFDLPIFTDQKQHRALNSAKYKLGSVKLERDLTIKDINSKVSLGLARLHGIESRLSQYENLLLSQSEDRNKASQRAYNANTSSFAQLVSVQMQDIGLRQSYERLITDLNLTKVDLAYWLDGYPKATINR